MGLILGFLQTQKCGESMKAQFPKMFKGSCYWHYHVGAFLKYSKIDLLAETQQNRVSITYTGVKKTQHNGNTILFYKFATKLYFVFIICLPPYKQWNCSFVIFFTPFVQWKYNSFIHCTTKKLYFHYWSSIPTIAIQTHWQKHIFNKNHNKSCNKKGGQGCIDLDGAEQGVHKSRHGHQYWWFVCGGWQQCSMDEDGSRHDGEGWGWGCA